MNFIIEKAELLKALKTAAKAILKRKARNIPILGDFLVQTRESELSVTATDLELFITTTCRIENQDDTDSTLVSAEGFINLIASQTDKTLRITSKGESLQVTTGYGTYHLIKNDPANFPLTPEINPQVRFTIDGENLRRMIDKTIFAVSKDELRASLNGVLLETDGENITFTATDGHRLASISAENSCKPFKAIIPARTLQTVAKAIKKSSVRISADQQHVSFTFGNTKMTSLLINEQYPNWRKVIPMNNDTTVTVNAKQLQDAVKRLGALSENKKHREKFIVFDINSSKTMALSDGFAEYKITQIGTARESIPIELKGDFLKTAFSIRFLLDFLNRTESERITFRLRNNKTGAIIEDNNKENSVQLLMPVRLD